MTFDEMVACLVPADQTIACSHCGMAWWAENCTPKIEDFHADDCPLKGRRDVHEASGKINYGYLDEKCPENHRIPPKAEEQT